MIAIAYHSSILKYTSTPLFFTQFYRLSIARLNCINGLDFSKEIIFKFLETAIMRIEKNQTKLSLVFSGYEYQAITEEISEPYELSRIQTEEIEISVRVTDGVGSNNLGIDCSEFDLDYFQLSEE
jgi:hypothetical protein